MAQGIRFYNVVWSKPDGSFQNTTEAARTRRHMGDQIRAGAVSYQDDDGRRWQPIKIQEIETPMIDITWLLDLFTRGGTKAEREAHREQAAYVLRLVETFAARVALVDGTTIER